MAIYDPRLLALAQQRSRAPTIPAGGGKANSAVRGPSSRPPSQGFAPVDATGLYDWAFSGGEGNQGMYGGSGSDTLQGGDAAEGGGVMDWLKSNDIGSLLFNVGANALTAPSWGHAIAGGIGGWSQGQTDRARSQAEQQRWDEEMGLRRQQFGLQQQDAAAKAAAIKQERDQMMAFAQSPDFPTAYPNASSDADRSRFMLMGPEKFDAAYRDQWGGRVSGDTAYIPGAIAQGAMQPTRLAQPNQAVQAYLPKIEAASERAGIDPQVLSRLVMAESGGNPNAISPKGATGLAQFMPNTARQFNIDPTKPDQSIDAAAKYIAQLRDQFGGDINKAVAAYNWGPGNMKLWQSSGGDWNKLPAETRAHVAKITGYGGADRQPSEIPGVFRLPATEQWQPETRNGADVMRNTRTGELRAMPQGPEQWREETRDGRRVMVSNRGDVRDVPGQAPVGQRFDQAARLRDDFNALPAVKDFREVSTVISSMEEAAKRPGGAADLNLVYGIAKIMDPGSVVREGEQVIVRNSQALGDQVQGWIGRVNSGQGLTDDSRAKLMAEARSRAKGRLDAYTATEEQFRGIADRAGINADDIIIRPPTLSSDDVARSAGVNPQATKVEGAYLPPDPNAWRRPAGFPEMQEQDRQKAIQAEQDNLARAKEALARRQGGM